MYDVMFFYIVVSLHPQLCMHVWMAGGNNTPVKGTLGNILRSFVIRTLQPLAYDLQLLQDQRHRAEETKLKLTEIICYITVLPGMPLINPPI